MQQKFLDRLDKIYIYTMSIIVFGFVIPWIMFGMELRQVGSTVLVDLGYECYLEKEIIDCTDYDKLQLTAGQSASKKIIQDIQDVYLLDGEYTYAGKGVASSTLWRIKLPDENEKIITDSQLIASM